MSQPEPQGNEFSQERLSRDPYREVERHLNRFPPEERVEEARRLLDDRMTTPEHRQAVARMLQGH